MFASFYEGRILRWKFKLKIELKFHLKTELKFELISDLKFDCSLRSNCTMIKPKMELRSNPNLNLSIFESLWASLSF